MRKVISVFFRDMKFMYDYFARIILKNAKTKDSKSFSKYTNIFVTVSRL